MTFLLMYKYSIEAIRAVSDDRKIELLRSLGRLPMTDYYTVPRSKRLFILEQGLVALVYRNTYLV